MSDMQKPSEELPPPTVNDVAVKPEQQATLGLAVAGTMEIAGTEDGDRPPLLLLFMADGTVRWVSQTVG